MMEFKIPRHWIPNPVRPECMIDNLKNLINRLNKELKREKQNKLPKYPF